MLPPAKRIPPALTAFLPQWQDVVFSWDFWIAIVVVEVFGRATNEMEFSKRGEIARKLIETTEPVTIGVLAVVVASFAIFATSVSGTMRERLGVGYDELIRTLFWGI